MAHWLETYYGRPDRVGKTDTGPDMAYIYQQSSIVQDALRTAALKVLPAKIVDALPALNFALFQCAHETNYFRSSLYVQHNNASGIKYAGQKGATKGDKGFAWFDSIYNWAASYVHEIQKGSKPYQAKTLEDFVSRLKQNRYFEESSSSYLTALKSARLALKTIPAEQNAAGQDRGVTADQIDRANHPHTGLLAWVKDHPLATGAVAATLGLLVVKSISK